jgi:hypothetical protein
MLDGGPGADPGPPLDAWLVTDARGELMPRIRRLAEGLGVSPEVRPYHHARLCIEPMPVVHTSHPTCGYLIVTPNRRVAWAPEFLEFPLWACGVDLLFADAAGWSRPIRFARGAGGHAAVRDVAQAAKRAGVKRLVFTHLGRPTLRALDRGERPPFGEIGEEGRTYR